jgi:hypothetical protein
MKSRMKFLAALALLGAFGSGTAPAQSNTVPASTVPTAVTVAAKREPVVTVLAPRERSTGMQTATQQHAPVTIGKAVDLDGDGLADAPSKSRHAPPVPKARHDGDCDDAAERSATTPRDAATGQASGKREQPKAETAKSGCAAGNPLYGQKTAQGQNPLGKE